MDNAFLPFPLEDPDRTQACLFSEKPGIQEFVIGGLFDLVIRAALAMPCRQGAEVVVSASAPIEADGLDDVPHCSFFSTFPLLLQRSMCIPRTPFPVLCSSFSLFILLVGFPFVGMHVVSIRPGSVAQCNFCLMYCLSEACLAISSVTFSGSDKMTICRVLSLKYCVS